MKTTRFLITCAMAIMALVLNSCEKGNEGKDEAKLNASPKEMSFDALDEIPQYIVVEAKNTNWDITVSDDDKTWLKATKESETSVKVTVEENTSIVKRDGVIVIKASKAGVADIEVAVEQKPSTNVPQGPTLAADPLSLTFEANDDKVEIVNVATYETDWTIAEGASADSWIHATREGSTIKVTVDAFDGTGEPRDGKITLTATEEGPEDVVISVHQRALSAPKPIIKLSSGTASFLASGSNPIDINIILEYVNTWDISYDATWFTATKGANKVTISVDDWDQTTERSSKIKVFSTEDGVEDKFITVVQSGAKSIKANPAELVFEHNATGDENKQVVQLTADATNSGYMTCQVRHTWISADYDNVTDKLTVTMAESYNGSTDRVGRIDIFDRNMNLITSIKVTQTAKPTEPTDDLNITEFNNDICTIYYGGNFNGVRRSYMIEVDLLGTGITDGTFGSGEQKGLGHALKLEFNSPYENRIPDGTYPLESEQYANTLTIGKTVSSLPGLRPGSWYFHFDGTKNHDKQLIITGGECKITTLNDQYTIECDFTTNAGSKITAKYVGALRNVGHALFN